MRSNRLIIWGCVVGTIVTIFLLKTIWPQYIFIPAILADNTPFAFLAIFLGALLCEYIDSSMGMGYGTTLTPLLLLVGFEPLQIVPAVLFSECLSGISASFMHQHDGNIDLLKNKQARSTAFLLSSLSTIGALIAVGFAISIPKLWLTTIITVIIISVGIVILSTVGKKIRYQRKHIIIIGALASFNKAVSGGGYGPLVTSGQVVSGVKPKEAVAITSLAEGLTCLVGFVAYLTLQIRFDLALILPLTLGALLAVPISTLTVKKMPENIIRTGIGVATCMLGMISLVKLMW